MRMLTLMLSHFAYMHMHMHMLVLIHFAYCQVQAGLDYLHSQRPPRPSVSLCERGRAPVRVRSKAGALGRSPDDLGSGTSMAWRQSYSRGARLAQSGS